MTDQEFQQRQEEQLRIHRIDRLLDAVQIFAPEISLKTFYSELTLQKATKKADLSLNYPKERLI